MEALAEWEDLRGREGLPVETVPGRATIAGPRSGDRVGAPLLQALDELEDLLARMNLALSR
jgi:hypothetical protein